MFKKIFWLAGVLCVSQTYADKVPENLKGLRQLDICPISAYAYIDGQRNKLIEDKMSEALKEQDILVGLGFTSPYQLLTCSQKLYMSLEAMKLADGAYVYTYKLVLYAPEGSIKTPAGNTQVNLATYYDINFFGISSSFDRLQQKSIEITKQTFQSFVLDWRKTH